MERRVLKKEGKCYIELPAEFLEQESIELFSLREGYYLLSVPLGTQGKAKTIPPSSASLSLSPEENAILHKLLAIRFDQRVPPRVEKLLNETEQQVLKTLMKKDYVNVFKSQKYPQGVYNIRDSVYPLLTTNNPPEVRSLKVEPKAASNLKSPAPANRPSPPPPASSQRMDIFSDGYVVFEDARAAAQFSEQLRRQGKSSTVLALKGFDGKFYAVTKSYFSKNAPLVLKALEEPQNAENIAKTCKLPPPACSAILHLLSEQGDVVEKRKGIFVRA